MISVLVLGMFRKKVKNCCRASREQGKIKKINILTIIYEVSNYFKF